MLGVASPTAWATLGDEGMANVLAWEWVLECAAEFRAAPSVIRDRTYW
jgi:hypothetical protein